MIGKELNQLQTIPSIAANDLLAVYDTSEPFAEKLKKIRYDDLTYEIITAVSGLTTVHNTLSGIQGGAIDEYYHLTLAEYTELQAGYVTDVEMTTISGDIVAQIPSLSGYATESYVDTSLLDYVPWNFGSGTISGTGDIYCGDIYTSSGTVYVGDLKLSSSGGDTLLINDVSLDDIITGAVPPSDKISEGNSYIEVVDTGTGELHFNTDGSDKLSYASNQWTFTRKAVFENYTTNFATQVADSAPAVLNLYGGNGGPAGSAGAGMALYCNENYDDIVDRYYIQVASGDDLLIGPNTDTDSLKYDGGTGVWEFTAAAGMKSGGITFAGNKILGTGSSPLQIDGNSHYVDVIGASYLRIGVDDTTVGQVYLYGGGSNDGGVLRIFCGSDLGGGTIQQYAFSTREDDLIIGPSTDTDALKYDGGNNRWQFSAAGAPAFQTAASALQFSDATSYIKTANGENAIQVVDDGAVTLYYNNAGAFKTASNSLQYISPTGYIRTSGGAPAIQINNSGSTSFYWNGTGAFRTSQTGMDATLANFYIKTQAGGNAIGLFNNDAVYLYYNNNSRVATDSQGLKFFLGTTYIKNPSSQPAIGVVDLGAVELYDNGVQTAATIGGGWEIYNGSERASMSVDSSAFKLVNSDGNVVKLSAKQTGGSEVDMLTVDADEEVIDFGNNTISGSGDIYCNNIITASGVNGWFDDGANFRCTVTNGLITNIGPTVSGGYSVS